MSLHTEELKGDVRIRPCQQYSALKVGVYLGKVSSSSSLAGVRGSVEEEGEHAVRKG